MVFPVCSAGENRSQVLYVVATELQRLLPTLQVVLPHGAESGYDPHQISDELNEKNFIEYLNSIVTQDTIGTSLRNIPIRLHLSRQVSIYSGFW